MGTEKKREGVFETVMVVRRVWPDEFHEGQRVVALDSMSPHGSCRAALLTVQGPAAIDFAEGMRQGEAFDVAVRLVAIHDPRVPRDVAALVNREAFAAGRHVVGEVKGATTEADLDLRADVARKLVLAETAAEEIGKALALVASEEAHALSGAHYEALRQIEASVSELRQGIAQLAREVVAGQVTP